MSRIFVVAALFLAGIGMGCNQPPTVPTGSSSPTPPQRPPLPPPGPAVLGGVVFQTTGQGRRPIPSAHVVVVDLLGGPYSWLGWSEVATDTNGRFTVERNIFGGYAYKLTAFVEPGFGLWNQSGLFQTRAVHVTVEKNTMVEIELVSPGVQPQTLDSPVLSGVVFEITAEGRRPAANMAVIYSSNGHDGADVYGRTDPDGRYRFWGLPVGRGYVLPACTRATTLPPDYRAVMFPVDILGDTVLDVTCQ